jgi:hypothetical protein
LAIPKRLMYPTLPDEAQRAQNMFEIIVFWPKTSLVQRQWGNCPVADKGKCWRLG